MRLQKIVLVVILGLVLSGSVGLEYLTSQADFEGMELTVCPQGPPACQFAKIQEAIESAREEDIIQVGPGIYQENLLIGKRITLKGIDPGKVLLKAAVESEPAILIQVAQGVVLTSMGIRGGDVGIRIVEASVRILGNRIVAEHFGIDAVGFALPEILIQDNLVTGHRRGVGIKFLGRIQALVDGNRIQRVTTGMIVGGQVISAIWGNQISDCWDGLLIGGSVQATVSGNQIFKNHNDGIRLSEIVTVEIVGNKINNNWGWGLSLWQRPCYDTDARFDGSIKGAHNEIIENVKSDLCPADYPWPAGFKK